MSGNRNDADALDALDIGRTIEEYDDVPAAYHDHPWVTDFRIPLVTSPYPRWSYEAALIVPPTHDSDDADMDARLYRAVWPTDEEAALVASYIGLRMTWYGDSWQAKMRRHALDTDGGTNTVTFIKTAEGWRFKRATWTGHGLWPYPGNGDQSEYPPTKDGLIALLRHINHDSDDEPSARMQAWVQAHPQEWTPSTVPA